MQDKFRQDKFGQDNTIQNQSWQDLLREGQTGAALARYLTLEERDEATLEAFDLLETLQVNLRAKHYQKALRNLEQSEDLPPLMDWAALKTQVEALSEGALALDRREPERALERLEPVNLPFLRGERETQRGTALIFLNDMANAEAAFKRALGADPKHYRALTNRGNLEMERGNLEAAIASYEAALKVNENFSNAHHNLGVAYRKQGEIDKSIRSIRRAQKAMREEDEERIKNSFSPARRGINFKYLLYGAGAILIFLWLRSQGVF